MIMDAKGNKAEYQKWQGHIKADEDNAFVKKMEELKKLYAGQGIGSRPAGTRITSMEAPPPIREPTITSYTVNSKVEEQLAEVHETYLDYLAKLEDRLRKPAVDPVDSRKSIADEIKGLSANIRTTLNKGRDDG